MIETHWHEHNPWKDHVIYVPIERLAACTLRMSGPDNLIPVVNGWELVEAVAHWAQYGDKLDAYILDSDVLTGGVRYGPMGEHYLSPPFSLPKLVELRDEYIARNTKKPRSSSSP